MKYLIIIILLASMLACSGGDGVVSKGGLGTQIHKTKARFCPDGDMTKCIYTGTVT